MAAGAFMMVRTSAFQAVGGFTRIRGEMLDDVALAKLIEQNGYHRRVFADRRNSCKSGCTKGTAMLSGE